MLEMLTTKILQKFVVKAVSCISKRKEFILHQELQTSSMLGGTRVSNTNFPPKTAEYLTISCISSLLSLNHRYVVIMLTWLISTCYKHTVW